MNRKIATCLGRLLWYDVVRVSRRPQQRELLRMSAEEKPAVDVFGIGFGTTENSDIRMAWNSAVIP